MATKIKIKKTLLKYARYLLNQGFCVKLLVIIQIKKYKNFLDIPETVKEFIKKFHRKNRILIDIACIKIIIILSINYKFC